MIGLLLVLQAGLPTVGDTIWVRRMVAAPPGRAVRAAEWTPSEEVEVLGHPRVTFHGDSAEVAYPVTLWAPGRHTLRVPGPLLVGGDGRVDSLPPMTVTVDAASVLPPGPHDTLRPQPATSPVGLREETLQPLILLLALSICLLVPVHLWWRRRGRVVPVPTIGPTDVPKPDLVRWAASGEPRAVIGVTLDRVRGAIAARLPEADAAMETDTCLEVIAERRPSWPHAELADLFRALDEARFAYGAEVDVLVLDRSANEIEERLVGETA